MDPFSETQKDVRRLMNKHLEQPQLLETFRFMLKSLSRVCHTGLHACTISLHEPLRLNRLWSAFSAERGSLLFGVESLLVILLLGNRRMPNA